MTNTPQPIPILTSGAAMFAEIARARALLAFDFDGTLAPIVDDPSRARMRPDTWALLRATALLFPCAVISGRARPDVAARLENIPLAAVVGNHGAEPGLGPIDRSLQLQCRLWAQELESALADVPGLEVEQKRLGLAVHYRRAPDWPAAEQRIRDAVRELEGARVFGGHAVVNVHPAEAPDKGDALAALQERFDAPLAVYVGDDVTDEDAFSRPKVVSIRVGSAGPSVARFCISSQEEVDDLLRALIAARAQEDGLGDRWQGLVRVLAL
ncbi:MAG: trehalose-phosphatase [Anaeromyxobacter sp.]